MLKILFSHLALLGSYHNKVKNIASSECLFSEKQLSLLPELLVEFQKTATSTCEFLKISTSLIRIVSKCLVFCHNVLEWEGYSIEITTDNRG